jgi:hypothetical protein
MGPLCHTVPVRQNSAIYPIIVQNIRTIRRRQGGFKEILTDPGLLFPALGATG